MRCSREGMRDVGTLGGLLDDMLNHPRFHIEDRGSAWLSHRELPQVRHEVAIKERDRPGLAELTPHDVDHAAPKVQVLNQKAIRIKFRNPHPTEIQTFRNATVTKVLRAINHIDRLTLRQRRLRAFQLVMLNHGLLPPLVANYAQDH